MLVVGISFLETPGKVYHFSLDDPSKLAFLATAPFRYTVDIIGNNDRVYRKAIIVNLWTKESYENLTTHWDYCKLVGIRTFRHFNYLLDSYLWDHWCVKNLVFYATDKAIGHLGRRAQLEFCQEVFSLSPKTPLRVKGHFLIGEKTLERDLHCYSVLLDSAQKIDLETGCSYIIKEQAPRRFWVKSIEIVSKLSVEEYGASNVIVLTHKQREGGNLEFETLESIDDNFMSSNTVLNESTGTVKRSRLNDTYSQLTDCAALAPSNCTIPSINTAIERNDRSNFVSTVGNLTNAVDSSPIYVGAQSSDINWLSTSSITKTEVDKMIQENNKIIENTLNPKVFNEKEKKENKMKGLNFDFGPCTNDNIRMSMYGLAVQNMDGIWVSYDPKTEQIIDVDILNFDGRKFMFKMPVAIKDVQIGDIIIHNHAPMFVVDTVGAALKAVDVREGERKEIIPVTNMFGFNFVTKVVSLFGKMESNATPDTPFGNMLPLLMLQDDKNADNDAMFLFMMMQQGGNSMDLVSNPMMMYVLMKGDNKSSDLLPLVLMMNQNKKRTMPTGLTYESVEEDVEEI